MVAVVLKWRVMGMYHRCSVVDFADDDSDDERAFCENIEVFGNGLFCVVSDGVGFEMVYGWSRGRVGGEGRPGWVGSVLVKGSKLFKEKYISLRGADGGGGVNGHLCYLFSLRSVSVFLSIFCIFVYHT